MQTGRPCALNYGFILYAGGDIHTLPALVAEAEETGWDDVFYWDGISLDRHAEAGDHAACNVEESMAERLRFPMAACPST